MKNLFTFIVALFMATGVYAQKSYSMGGLKAESFSYGDGDFLVNAKNAKKIDYIKKDGINYSTLSVKDTPISFLYKNGGAKEGFFTMYDTYFYLNGKGVKVVVSGLEEGQVVTFYVGSKNDKNLPSFDKEGGVFVGKIPDFNGSGANNFLPVQIKATSSSISLNETASGFVIQKIEVASSEKVTVTDAGFATFAASYPVDYSANGMVAYAVKYADGKLTYKKIEGIVPANTAVLLKGEAKDYTLTAAEGEPATVDTDLQRSDGNKTGADNIYCLANKSKGVGFYQVATGVKIPANKAYLDINATNTAKYYSIGIGGNTTGIQAIHQNSVKADGIMYSLSGQRVGKDYKGIVICNGKKMIKK